MRSDRRREAARRNEGRGLAERLGEAPIDAVDEAREAVGEAGLDGRLRVLADRSLRGGEIDPRELRRAGGEGLQRDLDPRSDHAAEVLAGTRDHVEVGRGAEVDRHAGSVHLRMCRDGVDEAVRSELVRVVDQDRHPGLQGRPHQQAGSAQVALGEVLVLGPELRDHGGDDRPVEALEAQVVELEQARDRPRQLIGRGARHRAQPPVTNQLLPVEGAEVRLRIADVDREQHAAIIRHP